MFVCLKIKERDVNLAADIEAWGRTDEELEGQVYEKSLDRIDQSFTLQTRVALASTTITAMLCSIG